MDINQKNELKNVSNYVISTLIQEVRCMYEYLSVNLFVTKYISNQSAASILRFHKALFKY